MATSKRKKILFCASELHHSTILFKNIFERISEFDLSVIIPNNYHSNYHSDMINEADLVVVVRNLLGDFKNIIHYTRKQGIKNAYAVDDNLVEIGKVLPDYRGYNSIDTLELLAGFDYIFCTNENLCRYYRGLTKKNNWVILTPASVPGEEILPEANPAGRQVVLGYFGSPSPHQEALELIAPALQEVLSLRPDVSIISAGIDLNKLGVPSTYIRFNPNYRQALAAMGSYRPNILIAPYSHVHLSKVNLKYKNIVKLFDAARLGAVLAASRLGPYQYLGENEGVTVIENDLKEWKRALLKLIDSDELRKSLFAKARRYIIQNHESSKIAGQVRRTLLGITS